MTGIRTDVLPLEDVGREVLRELEVVLAPDMVSAFGCLFDEAPTRARQLPSDVWTRRAEALRARISAGLRKLKTARRQLARELGDERLESRPPVADAVPADAVAALWGVLPAATMLPRDRSGGLAGALVAARVGATQLRLALMAVAPASEDLEVRGMRLAGGLSGIYPSGQAEVEILSRGRWDPAAIVCIWMNEILLFDEWRELLSIRADDPWRRGARFIRYACADLRLPRPAIRRVNGFGYILDVDDEPHGDMVTRVGRVIVDARRRRLWLDGRPVGPLRDFHFDFAAAVAKRDGGSVSRRELYRELSVLHQRAADADPTFQYAAEGVRARLGPDGTRVLQAAPQAFRFDGERSAIEPAPIDRTAVVEYLSASPRRKVFVALFEAFADHPGEILAQEELAQQLWPDLSPGEQAQRLRVGISRLRAHLREGANDLTWLPDPDRLILFVHGLGYQYNGRDASPEEVRELKQLRILRLRRE